MKRERVQRYFYFSFFFFSLFFRYTEIGPQVFIGVEDKVDLHDKSYTWTPKSWSFVKLHEIEKCLLVLFLA